MQDPDVQPSRQPADLDPEEFRALGYRAVDRLADFYAALPSLPVAPDTTVDHVRELLDQVPFPETGSPAASLIDEAMDLLVPHSVYNGHPRFFGFITPSAAPLGALSEMLAAGLNQNVASFMMAPMASEMELQAMRWMADFIGYPSNCSGILVTGGTEASFVAMHVAREAICDWDVRVEGVADHGRLTAYTSVEGHNWVETAMEMFGLGTGALRWVPAGDDARMDTGALRHMIGEDRGRGHLPFMVVATAGTTSTASIDPLPEIRDIAREEGLWFHVDGAYGAYGAMLPDAAPAFSAMRDADSIALDPHKWLYVPIEAGCVLIRDPAALKRTFSGPMPAYYHVKLRTGERRRKSVTNFIQQGPQATRGFRALKLWMALRHVGRTGYVRMLSENVRLAALVYERAFAHPELEALTHNLSIATFRYVPAGIDPGADGARDYLNTLNADIVSHIRAGGDAFITPGAVGDLVTLRVALVNFRTTERDLDALLELILRVGADLHGARADAPPPPARVSAAVTSRATAEFSVAEVHRP